MQDVRRSYLVFVHFYSSTWRNCDSPHRLSTAAWQIDDSGAWIPRCSQTALSVVNQSQKERFKKKKERRRGIEKWNCVLCKSCCGSTNLSGSDLNVKVVPLVWNLEDFRPSKSVYPESVFVHQEPVGTHAQHDVHTLRILQEFKQNQIYSIYLILQESLQSIFKRLTVFFCFFVCVKTGSNSINWLLL